MSNIILNNGKYQAEMQKLTFGAGELTDESCIKEYYSLLNVYYQNYGGRSLDTARVYGGGNSEKIIGKWIKEYSIPRENLFITTKGGHPPFGDMHACRLDCDSLEADLAASLKASGLDYFDLYLLHRDSESMPVSGIMNTLNSFVERGAVHFIGVSNWRTERIAEANHYAKENGLIPLSVSQINFSLARTTPKLLNDDTLVAMNDHEYQWYLENNFPVMAFSSQAKGFFAKLGKGDAPTPKILSRFMTDENKQRLERVKSLSKDLNVSPGALALAYLTCNPLVVSAVFRCRNEEQLTDTMSAKKVFLTKEQIRWLEA